MRLLELFGLAIIVYVLVMPWWPGLNYKLDTVKAPKQPVIESLEKQVAVIKQAIIKPTKPKPLAPHRLVIAKIGVNAPIVEGANESSLDKGVWHVPQTTAPADIGNMVLTGHRFKYLPPNNTTFYNLDKLVVGDKLAVVWDKETYYYEVTETKIVKPEQTEILNQTPDKQLTIYTCHPLWSQKERLVVIAKPL